MKLTAQLFIPRALSKTVPVREGYIVKDLTMPPRNWSAYDLPAKDRKGKPRANVARRRLTKPREIPAFLRKQAS